MKKTLKQLLEMNWKDPKMVDFCLKSSVYLEMDGYYLDLLSNGRN